MSELGVGLVTSGGERAGALEALAIDSLWVGGHVAAPNPTTEVITALSRLSAVTTRVEVGSAVLLLPLYQPAIVAKQIADLDRATDGRVILGVGVGGEYPAEFRAAQVPIEERGPRADEAIPLLRQLWTAQEISHDGRFYAMRAVRVHPPPARVGGPPIVVAGRKPPAMQRAARLGDGWIPYLYSPRRYAASVEVIRRTADEAERDLSKFGWYAFVFVNVDADGDRARAGVAHAMGALYDQDFAVMVDHVAVAGTPTEVRDRLGAFVDAGARHFVFVPSPGPGRSPDDVVARLLDDVMPAVRAG